MFYYWQRKGGLVGHGGHFALHHDPALPVFYQRRQVVRQRSATTNRHDIRLQSHYGIGIAPEYVIVDISPPRYPCMDSAVFIMSKYYSYHIHTDRRLVLPDQVEQRATSTMDLVQQLAGPAASVYPHELYELLQNLLCVDPWARVSATDALKLPFFD